VDYLFFLSYAREDRDPYLDKFFTDLVAAVAARTTHPKASIAFMDTLDIKLGEEWSQELTDALRSCRVFLPVYTARYFTREYCGREWGTFRMRQEAFRSATPGTQVPPRIIPVLWNAERNLGSLPPVAQGVQFNHQSLGPSYAEEGLRYLLKINRFESDAQIVIERLADRITELAKGPPLPALPPNQEIRTIPSVWSFNQPAAVAAPTAGKGPRYVQFIFVAGNRNELGPPLRQSVDSYGGDPREWKPYLPEVPKEIGIMASALAAEEDFFPEPLSLDVDLIPRLEAAQRDNKIVAIIVDTWTLQVPKYRDALKAFDDRNFLNCVVLVPWNLKDSETASAQASLKDLLVKSLPKNKLTKDPKYFIDSITSPDEFRKSIGAALNTIKAQILSYAEVEKKAGEEIIPKPII
jgi:FxsC-like protein